MPARPSWASAGQVKYSDGGRTAAARRRTSCGLTMMEPYRSSNSEASAACSAGRRGHALHIDNGRIASAGHCPSNRGRSYGGGNVLDEDADVDVGFLLPAASSFSIVSYSSLGSYRKHQDKAFHSDGVHRFPVETSAPTRIDRTALTISFASSGFLQRTIMSRPLNNLFHHGNAALSYLRIGYVDKTIQHTCAR